MYFKISKIFLFVSVLCIAVVTISTLFPFIVGKYVWFRVSVDLAFIFFLLGLLFKDEAGTWRKRIISLFKRPIVLAVSVFVAIFLLACLFGVDPKWSFWSNFERGEGGLQLLHLYVFFFLLVTLFKEEKDWRTIFIMTLIGGLGMTFYGVMAGFEVKDFIGVKFSDPGFRFQGSIGNSAYVAAYAIFMMFYAAYILVSKYKNYLRSFGALIFWFFVALFLAVFFAAATRGAFVGLIGALLIFLACFAFYSKRWRKWFIIAGLMLLGVVILLILFRDNGFIKASPLSRIIDISFSTQTFHDRAIMWQVAIDGWKQRPLFGWGPENFLKIFDRDFNIKYFVPANGFGAWFDRAHSVYFDYLAETGILGLLSFLGIWFVFYWQFFKKTRVATNMNTNKHEYDKQQTISRQQPTIEKALIFALPVAYLIQGIVLFDVLPIYMNIFMFLAFASYKFSQQQDE